MPIIDGFSSLPAELLQRIAQYGDISDHSKLRKCSRGLSAVFQTFEAVDQIDFSKCFNLKPTGCLKLLKSYPNVRHLDFSRELVVDSPRIELVKYGYLLREFDGPNKELKDVHLIQILEKHPLLESLYLNRCDQITDVGLAPLSGLSKLQSLGLQRCDQITSASFVRFEKLINLHTLDVSCLNDRKLECISKLVKLLFLSLKDCSRVTDNGIAYLKKLTNLHSLRVSDLNDRKLEHISKLVSLRFLFLKDCSRVTDNGIAYLEKLTNLQTLELDRNAPISGAALRQLANLVNLKSLCLSSFRWAEMDGVKCFSESLQCLSLYRPLVTSAFFTNLRSLTNLKKLELLDACITLDDGVQSFPVLKKLQVLDLDCCKNITDDALINLRAMEALQTLILRRTQISDGCLTCIGQAKSLQVLNLSFCKVTDVGLEQLSGLVHLRKLFLNGYKNITDIGLSHLQPIKGLQVLELRGQDGITDIGLSYLKEKKNLEVLDLTNCCRVTNEGLKHLSSLRHLQLLCLYRCHGVTNAGFRYLEDLTNLQTLILPCTCVTREGERALEISNPYLRVYTKSKVCVDFKKKRCVVL